jgi:DNA-binding response OmpR family regulator
MKKSKVLVLEPDPVLREFLPLLLEAYAVVAVSTVKDTEDAMRNQYFDLALLDVARGGTSAPTIRYIRSIRQSGEHLPIIATSAIPDPEIAIMALRAGSDDFVRKPWRSRELLTRIDRHIERHAERNSPDVVKAGGVYLDKGFQFGPAKVGSDLILRVGSNQVRLLAKQYAMLRMFSRNRGKLVTREALRLEVWGPASNAGVSSMTEYVSRLRTIFRSLDLDFNSLVKTQSGLGYRISENIERIAR